MQDWFMPEGIQVKWVLQRAPEVAFGQVFFWRPGVPRPKNHTMFRHEWFFGLAAEGAKAQKSLVSGTFVVFWPW